MSNADAGNNMQKTAIELCLHITDVSILHELAKYPEDDKRKAFAIDAMKMGIMVFKQVEGQVNVEQVRKIWEDRVSEMRNTLETHNTKVTSDISNILENYFNSDKGRFNEQIERLVSKDGDLENMIRKQVEGDDSTLARTLVEHVGKNSQIMKILDPETKNGLINQFEEKTEEMLAEQREKILAEFTLDNKNSALSRLVDQVKEKHDSIITKLDEMAGARKESQHGTSKGDKFERVVLDYINRRYEKSDHTVEPMGTTKGRTRKVGDAVITLGPEHAAAGAKIVVEAKKDASYNKPNILKELKKARENREADVGLFVSSRQTAPDGLEGLARHGNDIVIVWDENEQSNDIIFYAGLSLAEALCTRIKSQDRGIDWTTIDKCMQDIESHIKNLNDIRNWSNNAKKNNQKIFDLSDEMIKDIKDQIDSLARSIEPLRSTVAENS